MYSSIYSFSFRVFKFIIMVRQLLSRNSHTRLVASYDAEFIAQM